MAWKVPMVMAATARLPPSPRSRRRRISPPALFVKVWVVVPPRRAPSAPPDFAAKEAFLKAAGTGLAGPFALAEIEAVRLDSGAPAYRFSGRTAEWVARRHLTAHLTLSHDGGMAMAFCLLEAAPDAS